MKRIFLLLIIFSLGAPVATRAQDAATEERLNKLNGLVQDLLEDKANQRKLIESLSREVRELREQVAKPAGNFASPDDLHVLARKIQEVDDKRIADNEKIAREFERLAKVSASPAPPKRSKPSTPSPETSAPSGGSDRGFEHIIASGDTISTIVQAYREKGVKVTTEQILKANPGLKPEKLKVGQKIFIPAPEK